MDNLKTLESENKEHSIQKEQRRPESKNSFGPAQVTSLYSGPIPPPDHLIMYEKIVPGIAERFLEEPRREAEH